MNDDCCTHVKKINIKEYIEHCDEYEIMLQSVHVLLSRDRFIECHGSGGKRCLNEGQKRLKLQRIL